MVLISPSSSQRIGHFSGFDNLNEETFVQRLFDLHPLISLELASIRQTFGLLIAKFNVGIPLETISLLQGKMDPGYWNFCYFSLNLSYGSRDGMLPKLLVVKDRVLHSEINDLQPKNLTCQLMNFQRETVDWMLEREGIISTRAQSCYQTQGIHTSDIYIYIYIYLSSSLFLDHFHSLYN